MQDDDDAGPAPPSVSGKPTRTMQSVNLPASNCSRRRAACVGDGGAVCGNVYEHLLEGLLFAGVGGVVRRAAPWLTAVEAEPGFKRTMDGMAIISKQGMIGRPGEADGCFVELLRLRTGRTGGGSNRRTWSPKKNACGRGLLLARASAKCNAWTSRARCYLIGNIVDVSIIKQSLSCISPYNSELKARQGGRLMAARGRDFNFYFS